jgi:hypothetical protein
MHSMKEFRQVAGKTRSAVPAFLLGIGPDRQMHTLIDAYCPEPSCAGSEVSIRLFPERGSASPLSFGIDLFQAGLRLPSDVTYCAKAIALDFANAQWNLLARRRQAVRAWGLTRLRRRKEYHHGETFSFQDFQARPDHWAMPFDHGGRRWSALDASCVHPTCSCTDVQLNFFQEGKGREGTGAIQADFIALLDLKTGAIRSAAREPLTADRMAVVGSFQESLGDWFGELSIRRDLIRKIALKRIRFPSAVHAPVPREVVPPPSPPAEPMPPRPSHEGTIIGDPPRPGRNDLCPCGSGKKFKKCCGR